MSNRAIPALAIIVWATGVATAQPPARASVPGTGRFSAFFDATTVWRDFERLASPELEGRRTGTEGNRTARQLIAERFAQGGLVALTPEFVMPFQFSRQGADLEGVNVVGLCRGQRPEDPRVIVVSAHYDHVGVRNGEVYPGADDNASGTAALIALAGLCKKALWQHDVLFVAFDAEEQGLRGSRVFVADPPVEKSRLALNINMDMIARSAAREIYIAGTSHHPQLRTLLAPVAARSKATVKFGHDTPTDRPRDDWTMLSDHGSFHTAGIPFVYFGVEDHPDYHKPTDTLNRIHPVFFFHVVATVLDTLNTLDRALPAARP